MLADRFGWERVIALQLEYSLLERTIESDMMPMARELGLGITPWSPLRGGLLSGKYRRSGAPQGPSRPWTRQQLDDNLQTLDIVLSAEHLQRLNELTAPALQFPASYIQTSALFRSAGMTLNGETASDSSLMAAEKY